MKKTNKMELSEPQRLAVETIGKNVAVSAGAGSGKTRVLVERFIYLVKEKGLSPAEILALTFTEKAANEMKRRIVERLGEEGLEAARREVENAAIGTIHSFSARILREHPLEAGVDPHFVILESEEAAALQEKMLDETIEALVEIPDSGVFQLLGIYGEESVRQGVLRVWRASRNSELPFEELLRRRGKGDVISFEKELEKLRAQIASATLGSPPRNDASDSPSVIARPNFPAGREIGAKQSTIEELLSLKGSLRAAGKNKEAIQRQKETIDDYVAFLHEEAGLADREVFVKLALQFEKAYEETKRSERALDFDDLQIRAVRLLAADNEISKFLRKIYREKFREILVDEYQDTNPLQDRLLELIKREANLFIVGDFKQSIYGFRGTRAEIFLEKEKEFAKDSKGVRIPLVENHRSRPRLIEFINRFFAALWQEDGLPFDPLEPRREEKGEGPCVEWLSLEEKKDEGIDEIRIREARTLAGRIVSLVEEEGFAYKDIACLLDAMKPSHFYEQEFRRAGIPYYVVSSRDFYAQIETRDVLSFLSLLENPREDVPLAASLRSPFFQIADDTLFWLARRAKSSVRETPLIEGVKVFDSIEEIPEAEKEKLRFFRETFEEFLREKEKLRISELLEKLFRRTGYDLYVLKLRQGERRYANLRKLLEIAREMEVEARRAGPLHLGDFVRAVRGMENREVRESQAQVEAEAGNVVRLLSIHLSKGLEFPVVILPDLGGGENQEGGHFLLSEEGFGMRVWDEETGDFEETLTYRRNKKRLDRFSSEEAKRRLYVAMTRAEEKLILAGPRRIPDPAKKPSFHDMATWAEWVERILGEGTWDIRRLEEIPAGPFPFEKRRALAERKPIRRKLETLHPLRLRETPELVDRVLENLLLPEKADFERIDLPVSAFLLFAKNPEEYFSIYELGAPSSWREGKLEMKPEEPPAEEDGISPAEFGTRVHQMLERILMPHVGAALVAARGQRAGPRPAPTEGEIESYCRRMTQDLRQEERDEIIEIVIHFFRGPEAKEILKSSAVHPELPFVLRLPHGLIHGTLDLIYRGADGKWRILDYKTSRVDEKNFRERGEEYRVQMELYALAVREITGEPPLEARLHFLRPGLVYPIPFKAEDFGGLFEKFTGMQKKILDFRRDKIEATK